MRRVGTLLSVFLVCATMLPTASADYPELDRAPFPTLSAVPSALESQVDALRGVVRQTSACRDFEADSGWTFTRPAECHDWFEQIWRANPVVRDHAVGEELLHYIHERRRERLEPRIYVFAWVHILQSGGEGAARYLVRALSMLDRNVTRHRYLVPRVLWALEVITYQPLYPIMPMTVQPPYFFDGRLTLPQRTQGRERWLNWYREHGNENLAAWRAAGMQTQRANLESETPLLRVFAVRAIWRAENPDRMDVLRTQLASPIIRGRSRRWLTRLATSVWDVMNNDEVQALTRPPRRRRRPAASE